MDDKLKVYIERLKLETKWDMDVYRAVMDECSGNKYIDEWLGYYLRKNELVEENYDFEHAEVYEENVDGHTRIEIQAHNDAECGTTYFRIADLERSEAEYKKRKVALVGKMFMDLYKKNLDAIDACTERNNVLLLANNALYHTEGLK